MEVTVNDISSVKKQLVITVDGAAVADKLDKVYRQLRKKARIRGFRPGRAPLKIVRLLYRERARMEAAEDLVSETYNQALSDNDLVPLFQPEIAKLNFPEDESFLSFEATIEVAPRFEIENWEDIELERYPVEVTDEEVAAELEKLAHNMAQYRTIDERPAREGDVLVIDFVGRIDGVEFEGGRAEDFTIEIGSGHFIPELERQLAGLESGQEYDLEATFPDDYHNAELAGKKAVFTVKVKSIREKELPEIDDDLAIQISGGEIETLEELRGKLREYLVSSKENENRRKNIEALFAALRAKVDFELPESMVREERENMERELRSRLRMQGLDDSGIEEMVRREGEKLQTEAETVVANTLILEYLADREGIGASSDEVGFAFQRMLQQSGQSPQDVFERFKGREKELAAMMRRNVVLEKTLDHLLRRLLGADGKKAEAGKTAVTSESEGGAVTAEGSGDGTGAADAEDGTTDAE